MRPEESLMDGVLPRDTDRLRSLLELQSHQGHSATFTSPTTLSAHRLSTPTILTPTPTPKKGKAVSQSKSEEKKLKAAAYRHQREDNLSVQLVDHNSRIEVLVESFVSIESLSQGYDLIQYFCERTFEYERTGLPPITNPNVFNCLIQGYAEQRGEEKSPGFNLVKIQRLLSWMQREKVSPDLRTVAAIFSGYHPVEAETSSSEYAELALSTARDFNIEISDILLRRFYSDDESQRLLLAIRTVLPDFEAKMALTPLKSNNDLVSHLDSPSTAEINPYHMAIPHEELLEQFREQMKLERKGVFETRSAYNEAKDDTGAQTTLHELRQQWRVKIKERFQKKLTRLQTELETRRGFERIDGILQELSPDEYVAVISEFAEHLCEISLGYSKPASNHAYSIGSKLEHRIYAKKAEKRGVVDAQRRVYERYLRAFTAADVNMCRGPRAVWLDCMNAEGVTSADFNLDIPQWTYMIRRQVGVVLLDVLVDAVTIPELRGGHVIQVPAFLRSFRALSEQTSTQVVHLLPRPSLHRLIMDSPDRQLTFNVKDAPTVVPPMPWLSHGHGNYLMTKVDLVRAPKTQRIWASRQLSKRLQSTSQDTITPVLDAVSQVSAVPWVLNESVLNVMLRVFNTSGDMKLAIPGRAAKLPQPPKITPKHSHEESRKLWFQRFAARKLTMETHGLWCSMLYKFSIAQRYRGKVVWLPHNLDFRGRCYPVPPYFSHMGDDTSRGMLRFAVGKPLGKDGLRWLKIHLGNLTGKLKKATLDEREAFVDAHLGNILDSARNPLNDKGWWRESEEPWQTLAVCMEIQKALETVQNPEDFVSHLPVHQDGSCNGLQHYAALGRDMAGSISVNVCPSPRPQDVYAEVATLVEAGRVAAADAGEAVPILIGPDLIDRSVVKRTVMTIVYGVTPHGAKEQVLIRLKELNHPGSRGEKEQMARWIALETFQAIGSLFTSARKIQDWLTDCSRSITRDCMESVEWVSPMGLPVVHPYVTQKQGQYSVGQKGGPVWEARKGQYINVPQVGKQAYAFAPNFIHSLDASHMMMTGLRCQHSGLTFASVHDCFWTHAADTNYLNRINREEFVRLHETPILENLASFFESSFISPSLTENMAKKKVEAVRAQFRKVPPKGELDIRQVLDSTYFFS